MNNSKQDASTLRPGIYRHYKGNLYEVLASVRHSETREAMTLYRALYGEYGLWVRPTAMFAEEITFNGVRQPRFAWIGEKADAKLPVGAGDTPS